VDEFVEAGDGGEGLEKVTANNIDLILCDWDMPNLMGRAMTGAGFVKAVRGSGEKSNIHIVMITTEGGKAKTEEVKNSGANGYLTKPFTLNQLKAELEKFLTMKIKR